MTSNGALRVVREISLDVLSKRSDKFLYPPFSREDFWCVVRLDNDDNEMEFISLCCQSESVQVISFVDCV